MKPDAKHEVAESSNSNGVSTPEEGDNSVPKPRARPARNYYGMGFTSLVVVALLMIMQGRDNINVEGNSVLLGDLKRIIYSPFKEELKLPQAYHWNFSSRSFYPSVSNWDQQRATWIARHPSMSLADSRRPWVMMVTGSSPEPCDGSNFSHLLIRAGKNKLDYTRIHGMELYYSFRDSYMGFRDSWVKLPVIRMLMLQHPEVEWIWWLNTDAVVTNMSFEFPFSDFDNYNLVLSERDYLLYNSSSSTGSFTGSFLIRNSQWSLDLLSSWAYIGTVGITQRVTQNESWARFEVNDMGGNRSADIRRDDQLSLFTLLADDMSKPHEQQSWMSKVRLASEAGDFASGNWRTLAPKLEELSPGAVPFVTHFAGCLPYCAANFNESFEGSVACVKQLERTFDFADNQIYQKFGFLPRTLGNASQLYASNYSRNDTSSDTGEFRMQPTISNWDEGRRVIMKGKKMYEAMICSGSAPKACEWKEGSHATLRGFKNLVDYGRLQGIKIFYDMAVINKHMTGTWSKLPSMRMLMVGHPDVEWFWWVDSDAVFTSMDLRIPLERYDASGYNFVLYGDEGLLLDMKSFVAISTGAFLIRNCQWSLDFIERWASFGATEEIQAKSGKFMGEVLSDRPSDWPADDQTALAYLLISEWDTLSSKVHFEQDLALSGDWELWTPLFLDEFRLRRSDRPLLTHFAGCNSCTKRFVHNVGDRSCQAMMDKAFNFADNQILESYGLCHERLNSSVVTSSFLDSVPERTAEFLRQYVNVSSQEVEVAEKDGAIVNGTMGHQVLANKSFSNTYINDELAAAKEDLAAAKEELERAREEMVVAKDGKRKFEDQQLNFTTTEMSKRMGSTKEMDNGTAKELVREGS